MAFRSDDRAHEVDASRILSFWLAFHGGDLAQKVDATRAVALLAQSLELALLDTVSFEAADTDSDAFDVVPERGDEEALSLRIQPVEAANQREASVLQYCVKWQGVTIWTELPDPTHERTAA